MEENNLIAINFPQGAGGHAIGRIISSCNNVLWYDHITNGENPWDPYNDIVDSVFTPFHFTRRFKGAQGHGVCEKTVPPVLDFADRSKLDYDTSQITHWKRKLSPNNFVYPLHAELDKTREFFRPAKHIVVIPNDINDIVNRFKKTTFNYFISWKDKTYTYEKYYNEISLQKEKQVDECIFEDLSSIIENYKQSTVDEDVVVGSIKDLFDIDFFQTVTDKLDLEFNPVNYNKTINFIKGKF